MGLGKHWGCNVLREIYHWRDQRLATLGYEGERGQASLGALSETGKFVGKTRVRSEGTTRPGPLGT